MGSCGTARDGFFSFLDGGTCKVVWREGREGTENQLGGRKTCHVIALPTTHPFRSCSFSW